MRSMTVGGCVVDDHGMSCRTRAQRTHRRGYYSLRLKDIARRLCAW